MNKKIEAKLDSAKRIWDEKKGTLAVIATTTTVGMVMLMRANQRTVNGFLEENDLMEDFFVYLGADEDEIAELHN